MPDRRKFGAKSLETPLLKSALSKKRKGKDPPSNLERSVTIHEPDLEFLKSKNPAEKKKLVEKDVWVGKKGSSKGTKLKTTDVKEIENVESTIPQNDLKDVCLKTASCDSTCSGNLSPTSEEYNDVSHKLFGFGGRVQISAPLMRVRGDVIDVGEDDDDGDVLKKAITTSNGKKREKKQNKSDPISIETTKV